MSGAHFGDIVAVAPTEGDRFRPVDQRPSEFHLGGKCAAQALCAAAATVGDAVAPLSMATFFLGRRRPHEPIEYHVLRSRDGNAFVTRDIEARSPSGLWFRAVATFHVEEPGVDHQACGPTARPPEELLTADQERALGDAGPRNALSFPWDADFELRFDRVEDTRYLFWVRTLAPIGDDAVLQACAMLYATDLRGGAAGLLVSSWPDRQVVAGATLDHTVWFHRPARADQWLLLECHAESTSGARSFNVGTLHDPEGRRVASYAQNALVRTTA